MFGQLFLKECRQTAKSLIYYIFIACLAFFYFSQMGNMSIDKKPEPGLADYDMKQSNDKNRMMQQTLQNLVMEYDSNSYTTYPVGFAKHVTLSGKEQKSVEDILAKVSGLTADEVEKKMRQAEQDSAESADHVLVMPEIKPLGSLTFQEFKKQMNRIDDMLGGGSSYNTENILTSAREPMTYEDALAEYDELVEKDQVSGGYARLFCDYMGIVLAFLPIFPAVTRGLRDRRSGMRELVASRKCSSVVIVISRYLSMVVMMFLPVLVLSLHPLAQCIFFGNSQQVGIDYTAFFTYSFGWLLPVVCFVTAVGVFVTELTDTAAAVILMGAGWFLALFTGVSRIGGGNYGWNLIARHNTEYNYSGFMNDLPGLTANRIMYTVLAFVMVALTVLIYHYKRKGRLDIRGKIRGNRKRTSEI